MGSLKPWPQNSSARMIGGRKRCFCSSVPCSNSVGPSRSRPFTPTQNGARARACSTWKTTSCVEVPPRPAVLLGPRHVEPPAAHQLALPLEAHVPVRVVGRAARTEVLAELADEVGIEPRSAARRGTLRLPCRVRDPWLRGSRSTLSNRGSGSRRACEALAQHGLQHLAARVHRQRVHDLDAMRHLIIGDMLASERDHLFR